MCRGVEVSKKNKLYVYTQLRSDTSECIDKWNVL